MGRPKLYPVLLTEEEFVHLTSILKKGTHSALARRRANVLLHLNQAQGQRELTIREIEERCGVSNFMIHTLMYRFAKERLTGGLLERKPRNDPPRLVTGEVEALVIATACSEPPAGFARWTVRLLADKIILDTGNKLSKSTVGKILKKHH